MQPTIQSQARLKRVAWALGILLAATLVVGGVHVQRLGDQITRLEEEARATAAALGAAQRDIRAAADRAQAAESTRTKLEALAKSTDAMRAELEAKLKAAEAARAEAEAKLKAAMEKPGAGPERKQD